MVYINWDGFAWYYWQRAHGEGRALPVLDSLVGQGTLFTDVRSGVPSITNPMQTALLTGAWPAVTGNCYRYYDRASGKVVETGRTNRAETLAEAVRRQGLTAASVQQFMLENRGTARGDPKAPYLQFDGGGDSRVRFEAAGALVAGEAAGVGEMRVRMARLPDFLALYMDDLDAVGHNDGIAYGVLPADTEEKRLRSVDGRLSEMDARLGAFLERCRKLGIYDDMAFVLTADHGMAPYGARDAKDGTGAASRLPDLLARLRSAGFSPEVPAVGKGPSAGTDVVVVTAGLQALLSWTGEDGKRTEAAARMKEAVADEDYVGATLDGAELAARGAMEGFADLVVSPAVPYHFKTANAAYRARGQHDSLDETAQHVFALMWGRGVRSGAVMGERVSVIDFARTMTRLLGIEGPRDATGRILEAALR